MANRKRLILEIAVALLLILACWGIWSASQRQIVQQKAERENAVAQARQECDSRAERLAMSEATAAFRAFAAGIQGSALEQQRSRLDLAKSGVLRLPHVAFVHVLTPDGKVLTSSNEKYSVAGSADARASWALGAADLQTRPGDLPGTVEIAAPFQGASGPVAVLWMGYKTRELLEQPAR